MSELLTNFKDDILAESMEGRRRYQMITNEDGTVSFVDVTEYEQIGSEFGQAEVNAIHREINRKFDSGDVVDPLAAEESGFAADAKLTGDALREVSVKLHPVGSIYMSLEPIDPSSLFGGTWERIEGRFLLGASAYYTAGGRGGEATSTFMVGGDYGVGLVGPNHAYGNWGHAPGRTLTNMPPYLAVYIWKRTA